MKLDDGFDTIREPWKHQLETIDVADQKRDFALFFEPGTGKSLTAILLSRRKMWLKKTPMRVLVLCPPIVLKNWKDEWLMASKFTEEEIQYTKGSGKERVKYFTDSAKVVITNYESLLMPDVVKAIEAWGPEIIIYDEVHRLKNISAKRTKVAVKISKLPCVKHRFILTGTPVLNTPLDLFSQFLVLDKGDTFGPNFFVFRGNYFYDKNAGMPPQKHFPDWRVRSGAVADITNKIKQKSIHVKKSECLDLPPLLRKKIVVELSAEQKKLYKEMARDFIAYVDGKASVAQLALTKALRLQQIVTGFLTVEDIHGTTGLHEIADNPRKAALRELLADIAESSKVIVWCCFIQNYKQVREVCDVLSLPFVELTGETSAKDREKAVMDFQSDPSIRVCIANQSSGGEGVNLTASDVSVYYSRSFSLGQDIQSTARNYRGGSERHASVTRYDIVAADSIDEFVLSRLETKQEISGQVLNDLVMEVRGEIASGNGRTGIKVGRSSAGREGHKESIVG